MRDFRNGTANRLGEGAKQFPRNDLIVGGGDADTVSLVERIKEPLKMARVCSVEQVHAGRTLSGGRIRTGCGENVVFERKHLRRFRSLTLVLRLGPLLAVACCTWLALS